ncbi:hypothetical protein GCM10022397_26850 [Flavivirga jejuensis]
MNLKSQLDNYFFNNNNLEYYYRGFRVYYDVKLLDNNIIKFTETTDFTIVSNKKGKIELKFWVDSIEEDNNEIKTQIDKDLTVIDGKSLNDLIKENGEEPYEIPDKSKFDNKTSKYKKDIIIPLNGKNEYQVEKVITMTQKYDIDRSISFSSSKIIDDIFINVTCCDKVKVFFHELYKNEFRPDNINIEGLALKNKKIIMPGEVFILFVDKIEQEIDEIHKN